MFPFYCPMYTELEVAVVPTVLPCPLHILFLRKVAELPHDELHYQAYVP